MFLPNWKACTNLIYKKDVRRPSIFQLRSTTTSSIIFRSPRTMAHTPMIDVNALKILFGVVVRAGIEHHPQVLPANLSAKVQTIFESAK